MKHAPSTRVALVPEVPSRRSLSLARSIVPRLALCAGLALACTLAPHALARQPDTTQPARRPPRQKPADPKPTDKPADKPADTKPADGTSPDANKDANKDTTKDATKSTKPKAEAPRPTPALGPYITRGNSKDLLVQLSLDLFSDNPKQKEHFRDDNSGKSVNLPKVTPYDFEAMSLVMPYVPNTSTSELLGKVLDWPEGAPGAVGYKGRMLLADRVIDTEPEVIFNDYPVGTKLAKFEAPKEVVERIRKQTAIREVSLRMEYPIRCYDVTFDEANASKVPWPEREWPAIAESAFRPQMWIEKGLNEKGEVQEYDADLLRRAVVAYLKEEKIDSVKDVTPVRLAKILAQKVWRDVTPSEGDGIFDNARTKNILGFKVKAPYTTLTSGRGSPHDMAVALVALYRNAGLPARIVIGVDSGADDGKFPASNKVQKVRTWVEFCLYDEPHMVMNWIPVDIAAQRAASSQPQKLDSTWRFFGNHADGDSIVPLALHFTPPADGVANNGPPCLWGWLVFPKPPDYAETSFSVSITTPSKTGNETLRPTEPEERAPAPATTPKKNKGY